MTPGELIEAMEECIDRKDYAGLRRLAEQHVEAVYLAASGEEAGWLEARTSYAAIMESSVAAKREALPTAA